MATINYQYQYCKRLFRIPRNFAKDSVEVKYYSIKFRKQRICYSIFFFFNFFFLSTIAALTESLISITNSEVYGSFIAKYVHLYIIQFERPHRQYLRRQVPLQSLGTQLWVGFWQDYFFFGGGAFTLYFAGFTPAQNLLNPP